MVTFGADNTCRQCELGNYESCLFGETADTGGFWLSNCVPDPSMNAEGRRTPQQPVNRVDWKPSEGIHHDKIRKFRPGKMIGESTPMAVKVIPKNAETTSSNCSWCKKPSVKVREVEYGGGGSICPDCHYSYRKLGYNSHKPPHPFKKKAETFEAMGWHDPRWAGDREAVEAKFKAMYPTYTIEEDSMDYLVYSGGASNKYHVFFLATDPAGNYHSFNAYGRIGYTPTLHHNAGPGTKGSVTQAISKKRYQKSKKGYVQQAETFEADFDYYYSSYDKGRGMDILDRLRTMNAETKAEALDWLIDNGYLHSEEVYDSAYINAMGDALYITSEEEEDYDAEESFAHQVFDKVLSEKDYEKVELAKPIRTGWGLGAGIALFSVTATLAAVTLSNLLGENKGDE